MTRSKLGSKRRLDNGKWQVRVSRGYRVDGSQRTVYETVETEADADRRIIEIATDIGRAPDIAAGLTLRRLWELYLADKGARLAAKTVNDYERYMETTWLPLMADRDVSSITRREIQDAILGMRTRDLAKHAKRVMSSVLTYAANKGWLTNHPMRGIRFELPGDTGDAWADEEMWDDDPFAAIESGRDVWDARTVLEAMPRMRGLPLEPVWLAMVGGGLRLEEAFALRGMDVRRVDVGGRMVTQVAVHHARTDIGERKRTKTPQSVRIVAIIDPFGERYFELAKGVGRRDAVCPVDPANQNKRWRGYFAAPPDDPDKLKHRPKKAGFVHRSALYGLPYVPLSRMRATHSTLMQEAGVLDSLNAAAHGHTQDVARSHYMRGDTGIAAEMTRKYLDGLA